MIEVEDKLAGLIARLEAGQKFNAYETSSGRYLIAIGPVTNALSLTTCGLPEVADFIVAALRKAHGQPEALAPLTQRTEP